MEGLKNNIITLVGDSLEELRKRIMKLPVRLPAEGHGIA